MAEVVGEDEEAVPAVGEASEEQTLLLSVMRSSTCRMEGAVTFECKQGKLAQKKLTDPSHKAVPGTWPNDSAWGPAATFEACLHVLQV